MTLRRYAPMKQSRGTVIPEGLAREVRRRDGYTCVGKKLGWASHHLQVIYVLELDHVRASHGVGMKSETTEDNLVSLCGPCHRWKTEHGREARPALLAYLAEFYR